MQKHNRKKNSTYEKKMKRLKMENVRNEFCTQHISYLISLSFENTIGKRRVHKIKRRKEKLEEKMENVDNEFLHTSYPLPILSTNYGISTDFFSIYREDISLIL